ncbi:hypothetical protein ABGV42_00180 [Paenibacillus pabuli]|uniref:hypothetical protein n=1 Tax=Paenibacillus pabuli TaxID=1472 RepID=UPI0032422435
MPKVLANIIIIILVFILIALGIYPLFSGGKDTGQKAIAEQGKIDRMIEDSSTVSGSTVKQYMKIAGQGNILVGPVANMSTVSVSDGAGAVDFVADGSFVTGETYVIVNYWKIGNTMYEQAVSPNSFKDNAIFSVTKQYDVNGKLNRLKFTQVDMGK